MKKPLIPDTVFDAPMFSGHIAVTPSTPEDGVNCYFLTTGDQGDGIATVYGPQNPQNLKLAQAMSKAPELLASVRLLTDCLAKCLTGGEVSALLAGRALQAGAELIQQIDGEL